MFKVAFNVCLITFNTFIEVQQRADLNTRYLNRIIVIFINYILLVSCPSNRSETYKIILFYF